MLLTLYPGIIGMLKAGARLGPGKKERRTRKLKGYSGKTGESIVAVELAVAKEAEEQTARSPQALQTYQIQLIHNL